MTDIRAPAVAGRFYPGSEVELRSMVESMLADADGTPEPAFGGIVPHAGLVYSGACAAHVFKRVIIPEIVVLLAPNHTGLRSNAGGASSWAKGALDTPIGRLSIAEDFLSELEQRSALVQHDPVAHVQEHSVEVELPFLSVLAPSCLVAPIVLGWDDWRSCKELADALATVIKDWSVGVLLLASSDMTHFESASSAATRDRPALDAVEKLDGEGLLSYCRRENVSMCGRAPAAVVLEAAKLLGATSANIVDYRHSGMVTGDDASVVAYAGAVVR